MSSGSELEDASEHWIVIGLGNPGDEYRDTYHNVGFRVAEILAARGGLERWSRPGEIGMIPARIAIPESGPSGRRMTLVEPWTYMNRTGEILPLLLDRYGMDSRLVVVSDDLALPVGKIRIRERGSAGGHNGLRSISSAYGSDEFCRVRVGIDSVSPAGNTKNATREYVLSRVRQPDRETLDRVEALAADAVEFMIAQGVRLAMSRFNGMDLREAEAEK